MDSSAKKSKANKKDRTLERASSEEDLLATEQSKPKKASRFAKKLVAGKGKDKKEKSSETTSTTSQDDKVRWSYVNEQSVRAVFGQPLATACANSRGHDGIPVPLVVRQCIDYVMAHGLTVEGIYRLSAPKTRVDELRVQVEQGDEPQLQDATEAAALLKAFLRDMPDHLLTNELVNSFEDAAKGCPCGLEEVCICLAGDRIKALLNQLPAPHYFLAAYVCHHFRMVASMSKYNKMTLPNLCVLLHRTLDVSQRLLVILVQNSTSKIKELLPPFDGLRQSGRTLAELDGVGIGKLEEEMAKQRSLLDELHAEVSQLTAAGRTHSPKEQQLWDVQNIITRIRRKMRQLKQQRTAEEHEEHGKGEDAGGVITTGAGPCVEMFEEKQLLAVNAELDTQLEEQRRLIAGLIQQLPAQPWPQQQLLMQQRDQQSAASSTSEADWKTLCRQEERRHEQLVVEIIAEKNRIARLRAEIELFALQFRSGRHPLGSVSAQSPSHQ